MGGLVGAGHEAGLAKKKKKKVTLCLDGQTLSVAKKAKKKYLKRGATPGACQGGCTPNCQQKVCGDDGCGGSCGVCGGGEVCADGR